MSKNNNLLFRRAETTEDFQKIFELQNKNLPTSLSESDLKDGFLSISFTVDELQSMNDNICIMTCFSGMDLCGFHVATTPELNKKSPLLMAMMQQFSQITYKDKAISEYDCFIAGPSCIDKEYRGQGIYPQLIAALFDFLKNTSNPCRLRISFASKSNPRSLNAQHKIGCEIIGEFEFNANKFMILCLDLEGI
jgi:hypothetical protein